MVLNKNISINNSYITALFNIFNIISTLLYIFKLPIIYVIIIKNNIAFTFKLFSYFNPNSIKLIYPSIPNISSILSSGV